MNNKINYNEKIDNIFKLINELAEDKSFQKLIKEAISKDCDSWTDEDFSAANFSQNLIDTVKNSFRT